MIIEACYDIFLNEIIEYVIMNEEPAWSKKSLEFDLYTKYISLPINVDNNKQWTSQCCRD